ncbi:nucleolar protein 10 [Senna tora]|uniref:Nucleolar protein 10 n=1 Tax=Senna tora TaxID=362788 RepID=A0A834WUA7_9FABA|nr:nucleolar protein 10 [Senna tora]
MPSSPRHHHAAVPASPPYCRPCRSSPIPYIFIRLYLVPADLEIRLAFAVKVYEVRELGLKFERHLDSEIVDFQVLIDDYSKLKFSCADWSICLHAKYGKHHNLRIPRVACDQAEDFLESMKQRIGLECLVDEATGPLQWMGHMWRRDGWTKRAKYAKKTQRERQDKWTCLEDMFMYHVLRNPNQATSLPDSSLDEEHIPKAIHEIV